MQTAPLIFLTGFMGSGKTYWGRKLASALQRPFYDLDQLIEADHQKSIAELFVTFGEPAFRETEQTTLHHTISLAPAVIATGGGTPCFFDNMAWMNKAGITLFLNTPPAVLAERLKHERDLRPLLANVPEHNLETHISRLLEYRTPFYEQAQIHLLQTGNSPALLDQMLHLLLGQ